MQPIATILFLVAIASGSSDFSTTCLAEVKLETVPTSPTSLFLYRRCINTKKTAAGMGMHVERRLQRFDQYFQQGKKVNTDQKARGKHARQSGRSKVEAAQRARRQVRLQVRLLQSERNAKGKE